MLMVVRRVVVAALLAAPLVAAHGKVSVANGDRGGNGTALGSMLYPPPHVCARLTAAAVLGGIVPGTGSNKVTEVDTTVFRGAAAAG